MSSSGKINDLSKSALRKRFFENDFVPENNIAVEAIRVSSKKQEQGKSFEDQSEVNAEYSRKSGLKVVKKWEVAESASKHASRKHFHEMLEFIRDSQNTSSPVKHVVFRDQSRSNRNRQSALELESILDLGVTLHFARDGRKINNKSDLAAYLQWVIENYKNEAFIKDLTQNSMAGTIKSIECGRYPGSKLPFGYRSVGRKDRRYFELDGERAKYMAAAFEIVDSPLYATERLTDKLLKKKLDSMFPNIGKTPNEKRFCELLRHPFYTGEEFIYDKTVYKADPSIQPAIVSRERFERVQVILDGRKRVRRLSKKLTYTGMMSCRGFILNEMGELTNEPCGCAVTGEQIVRKYKNGNTQLFDYYRCSNQTRNCSQRDKVYMKKTVGGKVSYKDSEIEVIFQDMFKSFSFDEVTCQRMTKLLWEDHFEAKKTHGDRRVQLQNRMTELDRFIEQAYEDKLKGVLDEERWRAIDSSWKVERANISAEYDAMMDSKDEYMQHGVQLIELMQHTEIIFKNATPEKKRKMVELVSSNLLLADGTLEYHWKKPFDMLAVKGGLEDWRPLRDSNSCLLRERELS